MNDQADSPFVDPTTANVHERDASAGSSTSEPSDNRSHRQVRSQSRESSSQSSAAIASSQSHDGSHPALSFVSGSWRGGLPKGGSAGLGHHSLMQMMKAISLDTTHGHEDMTTSSPSPRAARKSGRRSLSRSMSSSIDAIYSPTSRSKGKGRALPSLAEMAAEVEEETEDVPRTGHQPTESAERSRALDSTNTASTRLEYDRPDERPVMVRGESTLSHRQLRRATLAEKLKEVFDLQDAEDVLEEFPCWLFRSVMLQGYLYLTSGHLCFYAFLQRQEGQAIRSGSLLKKPSTSPMYRKFWAVLREDALSWYTSSTDPYFPVNQIDLHYVLAVEASKSNPRRFRLLTANQKHHFEAESERSRQEWMKAVKKAVFRAKNEGESVKIAIPLETISAIDQSDELGLAETTLRFTVVDTEAPGERNEDEYFWSFGKESAQVVLDFRDAVLQAQKNRIQDFDKLGPSPVVSTAKKTPDDHRKPGIKRTGSPSSAVTTGSYNPLTIASNSARRLASTSVNLATRLYPFSASEPQVAQKAKAVNESAAGSSTPQAASVATIKASAPYPYPDSITDVTRSASASPSESLIMPGHGYPPSSSSGNAGDSAWTVSHWIHPSRALTTMTAAMRFARLGKNHVRETVTQPQQSLQRESSEDSTGRDTFQIVTAAEVREDYHKYFAAGETEEVLSRVHGYLFRGLPVYGYLYVTTTQFCFRSTSLVGKSKMVLPIVDMIAVQRARAYRLGYHGLVVVVRGHEEIFFELSSRERRNTLLDLLEGQLEHQRAELEASRQHSKTQLEAAALKQLEASIQPAPLPASLAESSPVMFSSTTSSFVTFKPTTSLRITCLTIGSRGDVQPYIALCLGLVKDGHHCTIASHPEYREWVESYGISYAAVGGDPAELMRICVENGMFTVSFLREGVAKFRGWLDDLLVSSWTACQGCDLLIESPSTMAGCHIAEALQVPYFKAFTMPWTRTRAYPHAFAVPEVHMGGSYNYMTYTIFDQIFWRAIAGQINRWRRGTLGLLPTNQDKMESQKQPFLYNFSPSVVPPPLDWMEYIHVTGYWFLPDSVDKGPPWTPPDSLVDFIATARKSGKALVYIGFGSIVVSDPERLTQIVVEAVQKAGVYAVISKGWSDRALAKDASAEAKNAKAVQDAKELQMLPDRIYNIDSVPHDWLFPRVDAVCHHGGAGTTGASLRAGKPTIIKPFFGDQAFWAERVDALKVGKGLRHLTAHSLEHALEYVTRDQTVRKRAEALGEQLRKENGVATAIEALYRDYEYAKSLIKRNTRVVDPTEHAVSAGVGNNAGGDPEGSDHESAQWDMMSDKMSAEGLSPQEADSSAESSSEDEEVDPQHDEDLRATSSHDGTPAASVRFERVPSDDLEG